VIKHGLFIYWKYVGNTKSKYTNVTDMPDKIVIEEDVKEFIRRLPDLSTTPPTTHLIMLAARSKKAKKLYGMKIRDLVVERKVVRNIPEWRNRYFNRVYNVATLQVHGKFDLKGNMSVPEVMGLYATISPRSVIKAICDVSKSNIDNLYQRDDFNNANLARMHTNYTSKLHKYRQGGHHFATLDIDPSSPSEGKRLLKEITDKVEPHIPIFITTETSSGYHIVLDISKGEHAKIYYGQESLQHKLALEYTKDGLEFLKQPQEPIPGTRYYRPNGDLHYVRIVR